MKTVIYVPDDTFERIARRARALGMSRSEFFTRAAGRYLDEPDDESTTEQINLALTQLASRGAAAADRSADCAVAASRRLLAGPDDDW